MLHQRDDDIIVRSTVELGRTLGLRVVAEGVEDEATAARLLDYGCEVIQGFWSGVPLPADALTVLLESTGGLSMAYADDQTPTAGRGAAGGGIAPSRRNQSIRA